MSAVTPIRQPQLGSTSVMTRRAWWLVVLNVLIPGSAQTLAGSRKLGRFGLAATLTLWTIAIVLIVLFLFWREALFTLFSTTITLWVVAAVCAFFAVLWLILGLDTLRLVRLVRTRPNARGWIAGVATLALLATSGIAGYGAYLTSTTGGFLNSVFMAGPPQPPIDGRYNIMLLGADSGPDREGSRPDSISVVSIDADTGQAVIIGLPRDMEDFPFPADSPLAAVYPEGYGAIDGCEVDVCMLNSIYTEVELKSPEMYPDAVNRGSEPGIEGMRDAAEGITGLSIPFYVMIDMQGFEQLIDALGGVTITVEERLPIGGDEDFNNVDGWVEVGEQHMNGYTALWYGRARHGTSDYDRMARQRILQAAVLAQFNPSNVLSKFQEIATAGSEVVRTDIPQGMLGYLTSLAMKTKELPIINVELVPPAVDPMDPDYEYVRQLIQDAVAPPPAETPSE